MTPPLTITAPGAGAAFVSAATASAATEAAGKPLPVMDRVVGRGDFWTSFQTRFSASHPVQRLGSTEELRQAQMSRWATARSAMSGLSSRVKVGVAVGLLGVGAMALSGERGLLFAKANLDNETAYGELMAERIATQEAQLFAARVQDSVVIWRASSFSGTHSVAALKNSDPILYAAVLDAIVKNEELSDYSSSGRILPEELVNLMYFDDPRLYPLFQKISTSLGWEDTGYHNIYIIEETAGTDWIRMVLLAVECSIPHANAAEREDLRLVLRWIIRGPGIFQQYGDTSVRLLSRLVDTSFTPE